MAVRDARRGAIPPGSKSVRECLKVQSLIPNGSRAYRGFARLCGAWRGRISLRLRAAGEQPRRPGKGIMIKEATAGAFVFGWFSPGWRLGLIEHPRMKVWANPGGHVERDETAARAAVRETEEETGLRDVKLLELPAPALPEGFPVTHSRVPVPWWIIETDVPPDNHLAEPHVHVDHVWVAVAADVRTAGTGEHPFAWYTPAAIKAGLPMFGDTKVLALKLFECMSGLDPDAVTGKSIVAALAGLFDALDVGGAVAAPGGPRGLEAACRSRSEFGQGVVERQEEMGVEFVGVDPDAGRVRHGSAVE